MSAGPGEFDGLTYEQLVDQLEAVTAQMASGDIGIEAAVDLYERAGRLYAEAQARLEGVRQRIEALSDATEGEAPER
jgi:exodeoxyribonuclease VII small subunit